MVYYTVRFNGVKFCIRRWGGGYRSNHQDLIEPHLQLIRAFWDCM